MTRAVDSRGRTIAYGRPWDLMRRAQDGIAAARGGAIIVLDVAGKPWFIVGVARGSSVEQVLRSAGF